MKLLRGCREAYNHPNLTLVRRIIAAVLGGTILIIGVLCIILPGPAVLIIPLGLAILATEFVWARHLLHKAKGLLKRNKKPAASSQPETVSSR